MLKKLEDLNNLLNMNPEGQSIYFSQYGVIAMLDLAGKSIGYGALAQLAQWVREVQCDDDPDGAAAMKRNRFKAMGWPLPGDFEDVAEKARLHNGS